MKRFFIGLAVVVVAVGLAALIASRWWFSTLVHSETFHGWLNKQATEALGMPGEFGPLKVVSDAAGYEIESGAFTARRGDSPSVFQRIEANKLRCEVEPRFLAGSWRVAKLEIDHVSLQLLDQTLRAEDTLMGRADRKAPEETPGKPVKRRSKWRRPLEVKTVTVKSLDVALQSASLEGSRLTVWQTGNNEWALNGAGGTFSMGEGLPEWRVGGFDAHKRKETTFASASLLIGEEGELSVMTEFNPNEATEGLVRFSRLPLGTWLSPVWRMRMFGFVKGDLQARLANTGELEAVTGPVSLAEAQIRALPVLDRLAEVTGVEAFSHLALETASAQVSFGSKLGFGVKLDEIVLERPKLVKVTGNLWLVRGKLGGTFQVGIAASVLDSAQPVCRQVFTRAEGDYVWATMQVRGTLEQPSEDLTERLQN